MEHLQFELRASRPRPQPLPATLVGVVASGNLEILVESRALDGGCRFHVHTAADGFGHIWQAVLEDFVERQGVADVEFAINDVGATPAVVSLRLDQALAEAREADRD